MEIETVIQNGAILQWLSDSMLATNIQKTTLRFHMYRTSIVGPFLKNSSSDIVYARAVLFDDSPSASVNFLGAIPDHSGLDFSEQILIGSVAG